MIDFRHQTFVELAKQKSYTKTAEALNMTQPAVTQHIKYLESIYGGKLVEIKGRNFSLTARGVALLNYTKRMFSDYSQIKNSIIASGDTPIVKFGATLTIGEYIMPQILKNIITSQNQGNSPVEFNMIVQNTNNLLDKLQSGEISFAIIEGHFDKSKFGNRLFSNEKFVGFCSPKSNLNGQSVTLEELMDEDVILREKGSGTRDIFESYLLQNNLTVNSFQKVHEIGNLNCIKDLVEANLGISFMYECAVKKELENGTLCKLEISDLQMSHSFNFVYLKGSMHEEDYFKYFDLFDTCRK